MANFLNQETLIDIAAIGGGSVIAATVTSKVAPKITKFVKLQNNVYANSAVPILAGLFLPALAGGGRIVNGLANGMIAFGAANIVVAAIKGTSSKGTSTSSSSSSSSNTASTASSSSTDTGAAGFMGNVMMQGVAGDVMMGSTDAGSYSSDSYDMTSSDAGEMNF